MGGHKFSGQYRWELAVESMKTSIDRFQHYSQMAIKYGDDMNTGFMSGISFSDVGGEHFDLEELEWLNDEIMGLIDTSSYESLVGQSHLSEYDTTMEAVIATMSQYANAKEQMVEAEREYNEILKEINKENLRLNLEQLKIQLVGMMRRRGNTRMEEKRLKQIEIEKTENRIEQMEAQIEYQEQSDETMLDEMESAYESASAIYEEYVDRSKFYLWELQDARDTELQLLIDNINTQEGLYDDYSDMLDDAKDHATFLNEAIMTLAAFIDENVPDWEGFFEDTAIEMAEEALGDILDKMKEINSLSGTPIKTTYTSPIAQSLADAGLTQTAGRYQGLVDIAKGGTFGGRALSRGTNYVPETGMYMLHRGESVNPPDGSNTTNGNVTVNIVNNNTINNDLDAEKVAKVQAEAIMQLVSDKTGKTKYRFR